MSTAVKERTNDAVRAEVDELLAMLDGEPECDLIDITPLWERPCLQPARWIGRLHCGHPSVFCDRHMRDLASEASGCIKCPCLHTSAWAEGAEVGQWMQVPVLGWVRISGEKPNMLPI